MRSLKSIKKRIVSVKNTQKITKAMKMVAAAKLRKSQARALSARHYTEAIWRLAGRLSALSDHASHPLILAKEKVARRDYLVLTSDRGLCGGFNGNLLRSLAGELSSCREKNVEPLCKVIGKKGRDYFKAKSWSLKESQTGLYDRFEKGVAFDLAKVSVERFETGKTDEVWICFNYFQSAMLQQVKFEKILPMDPLLNPPPQGEQNAKADYIYEPTREMILDSLLREGIAAKIYEAFLESIASEQAARMAAMENATNNASDMIGYLTLQYNRARQATITKDLMDIVNGAEALR